jgi:Kef-type K+ transport system membrane component KefB
LCDRAPGSAPRGPHFDDALTGAGYSSVVRWARCALFGAMLVMVAPRAAAAAEASSAIPVAHVALVLALILVAAKIGGEIAARLHQPPVLGELVAGMILGNLPGLALRGVGADASIDMLSQLGVLLLLFEVGLESTVRGVMEVGAAAARVAALGTIGTFAVGFCAARWLLPGAGAAVHVFLGASITATSIGITARVFKDLGLAQSREARTILGAAVIDDILGLLCLALVSGWIASRAEGASVPSASLAWTMAKTLGFLAAAILIGVRVTPRVFDLAARLRTGGVLLALGLAFCFFLSWAAGAMGLAPLVGAFAAGLVLEELHSARFVARGERSLAELVEPISGFLVPIFFVVMGIRADVRVFAHPATLALAAALTGAAVVGKLACALGVPRSDNRLAVAFGMVPRGEVSLIFANLGLTLRLGDAPVLDTKTYSALVIVVILTTFLAPIALKWSFNRRRGGPAGGQGTEA